MAMNSRSSSTAIDPHALPGMRLSAEDQTRLSDTHVERAKHAVRSSPKDMGIDLGGAQVLVAEKLLHGPDVVPGLEQVGRKAVSQRMTADGLVDQGRLAGVTDCPLEDPFVHMVSAQFS